MFIAIRTAQRITPACAGKSDRTDWTITCRKDHPRVCGEKGCLALWRVSRPGSPPHVRGKVFLVILQHLHGGITPAYAGKRPRKCCRSGPSGDHPRMCGEKAFTSGRRAMYRGSPPHVRGKANFPVSFRWAIGITPACAGKSFDNPKIDNSQLGSPPHMRGKARLRNFQKQLFGITPAHAGKSCRWRRGENRSWDHPRMCGEKSVTYTLLERCGGSPPRMRGKVRRDLCSSHHLGITPAHAGKRSRVSSSPCPFMDHPRMCGEKTARSGRFATI